MRRDIRKDQRMFIKLTLVLILIMEAIGILIIHRL